LNVLAIGAHFDDVELGCGGSLISHAAAGDNVYVYVATLSGFTNHKQEVVRANDIARKEAEEAMRILGVRELICGNFTTLSVEFTDELNMAILQIVDQHKIDLVYAHWVHDVHHDHQAVAKASLHSCRHVPCLLMYRSNWYHSTQSFRGNFYVDITNYLAVKEQAIRAHNSEMIRTGEKWIQFFHNEAENAGQRIGVRFAEVFELVKWLKK